MHHKGFADQFLATQVEVRLVTLAHRAALASPPIQGGSDREQAEQQKLQFPGHVRCYECQYANSGGRHADPQQIAASAKHFENQQHGTQCQPVPER
ncbi:hypothetical protein FQZ97_1243160 [compost metagenome]